MMRKAEGVRDGEGICIDEKRTIRNTVDRHMVIFSPIRYLYTSSKLRTVSLILSIYYFIGCSLPNSMLSGRRLRCTQLLIQHFTKS